MRLSLRAKLYLFTIPMVAMSLVLLVGTIAPFQLIQEDLNDLRQDARQAILAERFSRLFTQHLKEFGDFVLAGDENEYRRSEALHNEAMYILDQWTEAVAQEDSDEIREGELAAILILRQSVERVHETTVDIADLLRAKGLDAAAKLLERELEPAVDGYLYQKIDGLVLREATGLREEMIRIVGVNAASSFLASEELPQVIAAVGADVHQAIHAERFLRFLNHYLKEVGDFIRSGEDEDYLAGEGAYLQSTQALSLWQQGSARDSPSEFEKVKNLAASHKTVREMGNRIIASANVGDRAGAIELMENSLEPLIAKYIYEPADWLIAEEISELDAGVSESAALIQRIERGVYLLALGVLLVGFFTPWLLTRIIVRPILRLSDAAVEMGEGDWSTKLRVEWNDEIGSLTRSFNKMTGKLQASQSQLVHSEKLNALGELGAGIAHELNQPLTVIAGTLGLALDEKDDLSPKLREEMSTALSEAERMVAIINNIKTFARETTDNQIPMRLSDAVQRAIGLVGEQLKVNSILLEEGEYDSELAIKGDALALQQIVINVLLNAKDALLEESGNVDMRILLSLFQAGDFVVLRIEDNGPGIPEDIRARVFNPFFTTKDVGSGTGLGLSISHGIVEKHGGTIRVIDCALGGAGFEMRIPRYVGAGLKTPTPELPVEVSAKSINLSILVVDDEPLVRTVVQAILEKLGCRVAGASSGKEAREYLTGTPVDLVLTDFMMPEMSGDELILAIREDGIKTPVIVMTGGRTERIVLLAKQAGALECIEKPINRKKIRHLLSEVERLVHAGAELPALH